MNYLIKEGELILYVHITTLIQVISLADSWAGWNVPKSLKCYLHCLNSHLLISHSTRKFFFFVKISERTAWHSEVQLLENISASS